MLIVDAGPLVAAAAARDPDHASCAELLTHAQGPLVVPVLAVTEAAYFISKLPGSDGERAFARSLHDGELATEPVEPADWSRILELLDQYDDLGLGIVDASVIVACERLGQTRLATLDRRHFAAVRPRHCAALELLPA